MKHLLFVVTVLLIIHFNVDAASTRQKRQVVSRTLGNPFINSNIAVAEAQAKIRQAELEAQMRVEQAKLKAQQLSIGSPIGGPVISPNPLINSNIEVIEAQNKLRQAELEAKLKAQQLSIGSPIAPVVNPIVSPLNTSPINQNLINAQLQAAKAQQTATGVVSPPYTSYPSVEAQVAKLKSEQAIREAEINARIAESQARANVNLAAARAKINAQNALVG